MGVGTQVRAVAPRRVEAFAAELLDSEEYEALLVARLRAEYERLRAGFGPVSLEPVRL